MICKYRIRSFAISILLAAFLVSGCARTETSLKFTHSELKLIPVTSFQKVLSSSTINETVEVKAGNIDGTAVVKGFEGQEYVIVTDRHGKETALSISELTEIKRIRRIKRPDTEAKRGGSNKVEVVGEYLFYAPLVPVAIALWPALRASGLDVQKNDEDDLKARLVYEGMSKEDLITFLGEPKEKYHCQPDSKSSADEVWIFEKDKVLRGGRALFIDLESNKVYYNSYHTSFFKDNCSLIKSKQ